MTAFGREQTKNSMRFLFAQRLLNYRKADINKVQFQEIHKTANGEECT